MSNLRVLVKAGMQYLILAVLTVLALQTAWVGFNLVLHIVDAVEFGLDPTQAKHLLYNSGSWYIRWLSQMTNNYVRVPFSLLMMASPFLFLKFVRKYNMSK